MLEQECICCLVLIPFLRNFKVQGRSAKHRAMVQLASTAKPVQSLPPPSALPGTASPIPRTPLRLLLPEPVQPSRAQKSYGRNQQPELRSGREGLSSHDMTLARDCRGGPQHSAYLQQALTCSATLINSPFSCDYSQCSLAAPSKYTSNFYFSMRLLLLHCKTSPDERQCCSAAKDGRASSSVYVWGVWSVH